MNYVSSACFGCDLANLPWDPDCSRAFKRARAAIENGARPPKAKEAVLEQTVTELVRVARSVGDLPAAMCYIVGYAFPSRISSEALPLRTADIGVRPEEQLRNGVYLAFFVRGNEIVMRLSQGKSRPHGSVLSRWCRRRRCKRACLVCVLASILVWLVCWDLGCSR